MTFMGNDQLDNVGFAIRRLVAQLSKLEINEFATMSQDRILGYFRQSDISNRANNRDKGYPLGDQSLPPYHPVIDTSEK